MGMQQLRAALLAGTVFATGCLSSSYKIPGGEVQRLASLAPEARGQRVRVVQQINEDNAAPAQPASGETQIIFMPRIGIDISDDDYRRGGYGGGYNGGGFNGGGWGGGRGGSGGGAHGSGIKTGGGMNLGGSSGAGDGKAAAILVLAAAAVILVAAAGVEGSRFDGFAQLHPMQPVHLYSRDGRYAVMPLAWIDPQTAAMTDHAIVRSAEGPFHELERAPLDRAGFTYGMYGGAGTYTSIDHSKTTGTATTIQLGYFPDQKIGVVGSIFFGWRDNAFNDTLFESRYTLELQGYPVQAGPVHLGLYGGGGAAYRFEGLGAMNPNNGNESSGALIGGTMLQLDVNTRIALTARLGLTRAHDEAMTDAMVGISVY
ncbi:MAG: hypothetical protein JWO36_3486 [Myxococcales bacterium]|nr:hypothetical protein [Myxococcales bacterium]